MLGERIMRRSLCRCLLRRRLGVLLLQMGGGMRVRRLRWRRGSALVVWACRLLCLLLLRIDLVPGGLPLCRRQGRAVWGWWLGSLTVGIPRWWVGHGHGASVNIGRPILLLAMGGSRRRG